MRVAIWLAFAAGCTHAAKPEPAAADAGQDAPRRPVEEAVKDALSSLDLGTDADLDRAIGLLDRAASDDPTLTVAYDLGVAYLRRGRYDAAEGQFQRVTVAHPDDGDAWLGLGVARERAGRLDGALEALETGIARVPDHVGLRVARVSALRRAGKPDAAMAAAREALTTHARSVALYNEYGLACLDAGNRVLAKFVLQKAVQEIPGADQDPTLLTNLGWTSYLEEDEASATERLKQALAVDPKLVPALVYLARVYLDDHNYADAAPLLETASGIEPQNADLKLTLGVAYRGLGRFAEAKAAYEQALALDPANPAGHFNLGVLFGDHQKQYDAGVAELQRYVDAGGPEADRAREYIAALHEEREIAQKRAEAAAEQEQAPAEPSPTEAP